MHLEDINPGDWITPLDGGKPRHLQDDDDGEERNPWSFFVYGTSTSDQRGRLYHVLSIDFPFAICQYTADKRAMIDLRDHLWKRLSPEFVAAATGK